MTKARQPTCAARAVQRVEWSSGVVVHWLHWLQWGGWAVCGLAADHDDGEYEEAAAEGREGLAHARQRQVGVVDVALDDGEVGVEDRRIDDVGDVEQHEAAEVGDGHEQLDRGIVDALLAELAARLGHEVDHVHDHGGEHLCRTRSAQPMSVGR